VAFRRGPSTFLRRVGEPPQGPGVAAYLEEGECAQAHKAPAPGAGRRVTRSPELSLHKQGQQWRKQ